MNYMGILLLSGSESIEYDYDNHIFWIIKYYNIKMNTKLIEKNWKFAQSSPICCFLNHTIRAEEGESPVWIVILQGNCIIPILLF